MARVKRNFRISHDIDAFLTEYAKRRGITYTAAFERMILKGIEIEGNMRYEVINPPIEETVIENKDLNQDDMAILDIFNNIPD